MTFTCTLRNRDGLGIKLLAHAVHTLAVNDAAGVTSCQSALPGFVRFSESLQSSSRARSRIHSLRQQPVNLWD